MGGKLGVFFLRIEKLPTTHDRHHKIEQYESRCWHLIQLLQGVAPVFGGDGDISFRAESLHDGLPYVAIVISHQDTFAFHNGTLQPRKSTTGQTRKAEVFCQALATFASPRGQSSKCSWLRSPSSLSPSSRTPI